MYLFWKSIKFGTVTDIDAIERSAKTFAFQALMFGLGDYYPSCDLVVDQVIVSLTDVLHFELNGRLNSVPLLNQGCYTLSR